VGPVMMTRLSFIEYIMPSPSFDIVVLFYPQPDLFFALCPKFLSNRIKYICNCMRSSDFAEHPVRVSRSTN
jgi:hypothetical protein